MERREFLKIAGATAISAVLPMKLFGSNGEWCETKFDHKERCFKTVFHSNDGPTMTGVCYVNEDLLEERDAVKQILKQAQDEWWEIFRLGPGYRKL